MAKIGQTAGESAKGGGVLKKEVVMQHHSRSHRNDGEGGEWRGRKNGCCYAAKNTFYTKEKEIYKYMKKNGRTVLSILMTALCRCLPDHSQPAGTAAGLNRAGDFPSPSTAAATAALQPITVVGRGEEVTPSACQQRSLGAGRGGSRESIPAGTMHYSGAPPRH